MGNFYITFKNNRKPKQSNLHLQTPEARGFLNEISHRYQSTDQAVSNFQQAIQYLLAVDDFSTPDVQRILSFIARYSKNLWITRSTKEHFTGFLVATLSKLYSKKLFSLKYEKLAKSYRLVIRILLNFLEAFVDCCDDFCNGNGIQIIADLLNSPCLSVQALKSDPFNVTRLHFAHSFLCILRNALAQSPIAKRHFRDASGLEICRKFLCTEINIVKCEAFLSLAYAINEHENHLIFNSGSLLHSAAKIFSKEESGNFEKICPSLHFIKAFNRLAANDSNKIYLTGLGLLDLYGKILKEAKGIEEEILEVTYGIWVFSFDRKCRNKILQNKLLLQALASQITSRNPKLTLATEGAIWTLDNRLQKEAMRYHTNERIFNSRDTSRIPKFSSAPAPSPSDIMLCRKNSSCNFEQPNFGNDRNRVMISCEIKSYQLVKKIENELKKARFDIWIDWEGIAPMDMKIEMIEKSTAILICASDAYKISPICRSECEYIKLLHREFIPVIVEKRYKPDGWLNAMIETKAAIDLSCPAAIAEHIPNLIEMLTEMCGLHSIALSQPKQQILGQIWENDSQHSQHRKHSIVRSKTLEPIRTLVHWTHEDVQTWLEKIGLSQLRTVFEDFDGLSLHALQKMFLRAPAIYYCSMKYDFPINDVLHILKFTTALEMLK